MADISRMQSGAALGGTALRWGSQQAALLIPLPSAKCRREHGFHYQRRTLCWFIVVGRCPERSFVTWTLTETLRKKLEAFGEVC